MKIAGKTTHITPVGGNVFADLGFPPEEAAALQAESRRIIAEKKAIKEKLATEISAWISDQKMKQADAAEILGVTRPRVSDIVNNKTVKFSIDSLVEMLSKAGKQVVVSVH